MRVERIDHFVLTVRDIETTCDFYSRILGMKVEEFEGGRKASRFGEQKINLHEVGKEFEPKAREPVLGSADFCIVSDVPIEDAARYLASCGIWVIEEPVERSGAMGQMNSVYFRDPDGNLVEVSSYSIR